MYVYNQSDWPHFFWKEQEVLPLLIALRYQQGHLLGKMETIGFQIRKEATVENLTQDVVKSSEIEGEILDYSLVRSSVARHLGIEEGGVSKVDRNIEGVVEMILDATQEYDQSLTQERIWNWHLSLFPKGRSGWSAIQVGKWREKPVQVISAPSGKEILHFEGPPSSKVAKEMALFFQWVQEEKEDLLIKAAIAHLWFVTIHPFEDGNGRIGRAIADHLLARSEKSSARFYSLSTQIQKERRAYYAMLEETQKGNLDITPWIKWFLQCLGRAIANAEQTLEKVLRNSQFWDRLAHLSLNKRQKKVLSLLLEEFQGKLTTSKWAKLAKCSQDSAYRDIMDLVEKQVLKKNEEGGRSSSYSLL